MSPGLPKWTRAVLGPETVPSTNERRTIIFNDSKITSGTPPSNRSATDYGKFFPRGMRGVLEEIQIYCKGDAVDSIIISVSPQPGLGPTHETTIVPTAVWGWQDAAFNIMWNYDSMFIWISACEAAVFWGYDDKENRDGHYTDDSGATFTDLDERPFFRAVMTGETAGDVPVSGIINTIPIPSASSRVIKENTAVTQNVETTFIDVDGAGYCDYIEAIVLTGAAAHGTKVRVYCDGTLVMEQQYSALWILDFTDSTPTVSLLEYNTGGRCMMSISKRFEFKRKFEVRLYTLGSGVTADVYAYPTLIK